MTDLIIAGAILGFLLAFESLTGIVSTSAAAGSVVTRRLPWVTVSAGTLSRPSLPGSPWVMTIRSGLASTATLVSARSIWAKRRAARLIQNWAGNSSESCRRLRRAML